MSMTPFASASADLTALGYSCLPIIPPSASHHKGRGKAPGVFVSGTWRGLDKWQRYRDSSPTSFDLGMWHRAPDANIGLVLGTRAGDDMHVIAIDIDIVDEDAFDTLISCLPRSPMRKCGAKGMTVFYRAPKTIKTKCYDDMRIPRESGLPRRLVDLLTGFDTRQTVVPPSVHPDGPVYRWLDGPVASDALPIFDEDALEKLEDTLRTLGWDPETAPSSGIERKPRDPNREVDPDDMWSEVKTEAMNRLGDWVPDLDLYNLKRARQGYECVESWRASSTGRHLADRKRNLSIQPDGIKDWGSNNTYSAIDLVMAAKDCDQAEATDWLRVKLGLKDEGVVIALGEPAKPVLDASMAEAGIAALQSISFKPASDSLQPITPRPLSRELPEHLTRVPGLVGQLTDWISDSSRRPQRGGAMLAALLLVGTAAGRQYSGPTLTGTHMYGLFLAPSGAAKDHPLKAVGRVLHACGMGQHFGPSQFMSMSALIKRMGRQPLTLSCIDEFGSFLTRINGRKASTHEKAITGVLRTAWGSSFDTMAPPEWAGMSSEPIHSPAFSMFGATVHEEFFEALEGGDVFNGFLNRFLIISTHERAREREPTADKMTVPEPIIEGMRAIYDNGNPLVRATSHASNADGPERIVPWDTDSARRIYMALSERLFDVEHGASFFARTAEMAQRLATIRAIGQNYLAPRITTADMEWGEAVALWSAERMMADADDYMHENEHARLSAQILSAVRQNGSLARTELVRRFYKRVDGRVLDSILKSLVEGEMLVEQKVAAGPSGGRPKMVYVMGR